MTPPPATPGTEPSAEAKEAASAVWVLIARRIPFMGDVANGTHADYCKRDVALALDARARAYAVEQLEEVAKAQCHRCESEPPIYKPHSLDWWWHPQTETWRWPLCGAGTIHDRIRLLRDQGTGE
jgi:hypothetical protein